MQQTQELTPEQISVLEVYKCITENRPINRALTLSDLEQVKDLSEELKIAEEQDKPKIDKINKLEDIVREKMIQIEALRSQLNQNLLYLASHPEAKLKPMSTNNVNRETKPEYAGITEEAILKVLKEDLVYGGGNSQIAEKLHIENSKGVQQKIYTVCKNSEKIISANRGMWKLK